MSKKYETGKHGRYLTPCDFTDNRVGSFFCGLCIFNNGVDRESQKVECSVYDYAQEFFEKNKKEVVVKCR